MRASVALLLAWFLMASLPAQTSGGQEVLRGEAMTALTQIENAFRKAKGVSVRQAPEISDAESQEPLDRLDLIEEFERIVDTFRPRFVMSPRPLRVNERAIESRNPESHHEVLTELVYHGFVSPVGPVVVSEDRRLSVYEYGKALSFFFSRLAQFTNITDPEFSPNVKEG